MHLAGPGGNLDDLCRLQYDADGEPAAAHDHLHVHTQRRRADQPSAGQELGSLVLLVLLYMVQGVPLGLSTGALPFMLSSKLSYTQMGIFALSSYPYSLKLLWSPIVDSLYSRWLGRRKSWIVPIQLITAYLLITCADWIQSLYDQADVGTLTWLFGVVVFLMATQDIAVDGWALTLLSPANVSYASTCQTVGQTTGIFTSFTVFLALQDPAFCNSVLGSQPSDVGLVSLAGYMRFWGWGFAAVTVIIALAVKENNGPRVTLKGAAEFRGAAVSEKRSNNEGSVAVSELRDAYVQLWRVIRLPAVWRLTALLLSYRLGVLAAEGAASLKLIDKGVAKEALAFLVLFQFPLELLSAVIAGRWAASHSPYWPFITGYWLRLVTATATVAVTVAFPAGASSLADHSRAFGALAAVSLATSFVSYLGFTAQGSFFNTVSDPDMGGTYLTLLNTIANMGFMLPRTPLFWLMDALTVTRCTAPDGRALPYSCPKKMTDMARRDSVCATLGGECSLASDGYYIVSVASLVVGVGLGVLYVRFVWRLMREPLVSWRVRSVGGGGRSTEAAAESASRTEKELRNDEE
ncbi:hypothetical protein VOLCADRAFT_81605 [Volvox carteri f. nagariensis]|uniref:Uncharacterized protein n=1 Tax=Volvox carteri f. nagariensis TaxID=3068 RepID=D8TZE8_VOLCA|nr:uncharacterized protein VOLCADRAFT_81605 [Volvox carteri f. nagariensis]EFJ47264.1 hypothetical protein VOLCADRAFT_81605 [Volvox carteri f. nagariensis]|eukprot:XP_002951813.1 hypothetical protein VOLCADRAFT_81605 [Volvox carteri f. nagariensis]